MVFDEHWKDNEAENHGKQEARLYDVVKAFGKFSELVGCVLDNELQY